MEPTILSNLVWWAEATALFLLSVLVIWYGFLPAMPRGGGVQPRPLRWCILRFASHAGVLLAALLLMLLGCYLLFAAEHGADLGTAGAAWAWRYMPIAAGALAIGAGLVAGLGAARNRLISWALRRPRASTA